MELCLCATPIVHYACGIHCTHGLDIKIISTKSSKTNHAGSIDMETDIFTELQLITKGDGHAIALVSTDHQRLDVLTLNSVFHAAGIMVAF